MKEPGGWTTITIDIDDLTPIGAVHLDATGYQTLGIRFATAAQ